MKLSARKTIVTRVGAEKRQFYAAVVSRRPFQSTSVHTISVRIRNKHTNVVIGCLRATDCDFKDALKSHDNGGYNYGYIGNGPNGWVYDSDGK